MICLDTSALVDYLEGEEAIGEYLEDHEGRPYFAPTVALHEVFVGAARLEGAEGIERTREALDWLEPLPLSIDAAAEAAIIEAELHDAGAPIGSMDAAIAGVIRDVGGTVLTAHDHFERVPGLDVETYRE